MLDRIADRITQSFIRNKIIDEEDRELYQFGVYRGMILLLNLAVAVIIGIMMGGLWQTIAFLICFASLRVYSGGYHEKTQIRCFIASAFMLIMAVYMILYITFSWWMYVIVAVITGACVFWLAPMEHENRQFTSEELKRYRKIARSIWGIEMVILLLAFRLKFYHLCDGMAVSFAFASFLLLLGKLERYMHNKIRFAK